MSYVQTLLPLEYHANSNPHDFIISSCNLQAYKIATDNIDLPYHRALIIGEKGSGKTHLTNIWKKKQNALNIEPNVEMNFQHLQNKNLLMENVHLISNEEWLLHMMNFASNAQVKLMMTSITPLSPMLKDLKSRINSTAHIFIKPPDVDLIHALIQKALSDKQILIKSNILDYICTRIPRSFKVIAELVDIIDHYSLQNKREITIQFIKDIFDQSYILHQPI